MHRRLPPDFLIVLLHFLIFPHALCFLATGKRRMEVTGDGFGSKVVWPLLRESDELLAESKLPYVSAERKKKLEAEAQRKRTKCRNKVSGSLHVAYGRQIRQMETVMVRQHRSFCVFNINGDVLA